MEKPVITMYYRHGCHLCEDMFEHLTELQKVEHFLVETIDVDINDELKENFGSLVPVLEANGEELCRYYLDEVALRDYFRSQTSKVS